MVLLHSFNYHFNALPSLLIIKACLSDPPFHIIKLGKLVEVRFWRNASRACVLAVILYSSDENSVGRTVRTGAYTWL